MNERFGTSFADLLKDAGVEKLTLAADYELPPKFIGREQIPEVLREKIVTTLGRLEQSDMAMPFLHITAQAVTTRDGQTVDTDFINMILKEGLAPNTNGSGFVTRSIEKRAEIANPAEFSAQPEEFLDDLYQILKKYTFHGQRTNKRQLIDIVGAGITTGAKTQRHTAHGKGHPILIAADITNIPLKRGVDGDEHFVNLHRVAPQNIIGTVDITKLNDAEEITQETLMEMAETLLDRINQYLDKPDSKQ